MLFGVVFKSLGSFFAFKDFYFSFLHQGYLWLRFGNRALDIAPKPFSFNMSLHVSGPNVIVGPIEFEAERKMSLFHPLERRDDEKEYVPQRIFRPFLIEESSKILDEQVNPLQSPKKSRARFSRHPKK